MDRVGGSYRDLEAVRRNARDYDDVLLVIAGEAKRAKLQELKARAKGGH